MMVKLVMCLCICLVVLLCSIAGVLKGLDDIDSMKTNREMFGVIVVVASAILLFAGLVGVVIFAAKLFAFYLCGAPYPITAYMSTDCYDAGAYYWWTLENGCESKMLDNVAAWKEIAAPVEVMGGRETDS